MRATRLRSLSRRAAALALLLCAGASAAQEPGDEATTTAYLESIRWDTPALVAFLREMPKGADLHSHLSGAVYAESFLRWAAEDGACVSSVQLRIIPGPCANGSDTVAATLALANDALYSALIDALSMRNWHSARINGHDQFFATFGRTYSTRRRTGDMLAEAASRAAAGKVSYLELMFTPDGGAARSLGDRAGWLGDFVRMRDTLLVLRLSDVVALARARIDSVEARRDTVLACGTPAADPGCAVAVGWLYQVLRAMPPEQVFAQILTGFILARDDPRVVGFNLVQPEDALIAMRDYSLHMRMIGALRPLYPGVRVSLHAGELASGLVPPEGLRFHVREAVEVAGASRIGHGVSVMHEDRPYELLAEMARRGVLVEINLTSNDVILGVKGRDHPLRAYLTAGVPVALSTDDEGVARSEMTREYVRAVQDQLLGYPQLKAMARASLRHSFADETTKTRLMTELESSFSRFERAIAQRAR
ncbi:MAG: adenosine deaminase family protein [Gemmatimonadaceae bacterium]